jgi:hypothetical protein
MNMDHSNEAQPHGKKHLRIYLIIIGREDQTYIKLVIPQAK